MSPSPLRAAIAATGNASTGPVYNAYAGGKDNFEADRTLAGQVVAIAPDAADRAADLAGFALAAAAAITADVGQLVDIGAGAPAGDSVYRVARRVNPGTRLVSVDHDPVVLAQLRAEAGDRTVIERDVRDVAALLHELDTVVDWSRPLGVLLCAVLHFVADYKKARVACRGRHQSPVHQPGGAPAAAGCHRWRAGRSAAVAAFSAPAR